MVTLEILNITPIEHYYGLIIAITGYYKLIQTNQLDKCALNVFKCPFAGPFDYYRNQGDQGKEAIETLSSIC
jgi:hypothetical protein